MLAAPNRGEESTVQQEGQIIQDAAQVARLLDEMAASISALARARERAPLRMIGVRTGGLWVAQALRQRLGLDSPLGELNIAFYRDDFSQLGLHPSVEPSNLPFDVEGANILLVDDILYTGRTIRAALNEIFDYGRPASIMLAVLLDRGGRELPVAADVTGLTMTLGRNEQAKLTAADDLTLRVVRAG
jgi:pyrimidine operon attenuation protein / uracil phosphoribosyltransferase